ncbi:class I SAM-dependent methyltransferase [Rickettsiella endosymbiont of Rhagonycha lignosa]|uniref:class I SAM-dependent methyltransferase n=1 Tax=Rickettsiella endosymbiont of Rhagonycha lignosa TaxID=3077937 RepID=UPI00313B8CB8
MDKYMKHFLIKFLMLRVKLARYIRKYNSYSRRKINLDSPKLASKNHPYTPFKELYYNHKQNVSDKWSHYFDIYDEFFKRFIEANANVLEIGIQNGGSLQILNKYFKNAHIYGVDINPKVLDLRLEENILVHNFDITDEQTLKKSFKNITFDIIIDDGSHICSDIITTFNLLFPRLKPGGVYLIEDLHTSYWSSHGGAYLNEGSAIEFFKKFIDILNFYHIKDSHFNEKLTLPDFYIIQWLQSINFQDSVIVINKSTLPRKIPHKRVIVGNLEPVTPVLEEAKMEGWYHINN